MYSSNKTIFKGIEASAIPTVSFVLVKIICQKYGINLSIEEIIAISVSLNGLYYSIKNVIKYNLAKKMKV